MKFSFYMKGAVWDLLLVVLVSVAMTYQLFNCFYVDEALQYGVVPGIIVVLICVALICITFNRRTSRLGGIAYGIVALLGIAGCAAVTGAGLFTDNETNYFIVSMIIVLTPTFAFLLSRTRTGTAFLFIICAFMTALIQFFYMRYEIHWAFLGIFASVALIIYKNYQLSARTSTTVRKLSFVPGALTAVVSVALAMGLGAGVWFGIIAPLDPGAFEIKLITEYRALETKSVVGVSDVYMTPNTDLKSDQTSLDHRTTDQIVEENGGIDTPANGQDKEQDQSVGSSASFMGINPESIVAQFQAITYETVSFALLVALIVIVAVCLVYFVDRRVYRAQRLKKFQRMEPNDQAKAVYLFLVDKLKIIGLGVPEGQTTLEYARSIDASMEVFDAGAEASFKDLTGMYTAVVYGKRDVDQADLDLFAKYYKSFWKSARKYLGNFKYFRKAFRLG